MAANRLAGAGGARLVCIVLALVAGYVRRAAVDSDQFANRATAALRDDSVRSLIAEKVTDEVVLKQEARSDRGSPDHRVRGLRDRRQPRLHEPVPDGGARRPPRPVRPGPGHRHVDRRRRGHGPGRGARAAAPVARRRSVDGEGGAGAARTWAASGGDSGARRRATYGSSRPPADSSSRSLLVAGALLLSPDRRGRSSSSAWGPRAGGVLLIVAYGVVRSIAIDQVDGPEEQAAARRRLGRVPRGPANGGLDPGRVGSRAGRGGGFAHQAAALRRAARGRRRLARPGAPAARTGRALRGLGFVAAGLLVIVQPERGPRCSCHAGRRLPDLRGRAGDPEAGLQAARSAPSAGPRAGRCRRLSTPASGDRRRSAVVVIAVVVAVFLGSGGTTTAAPAAGACNGHDGALRPAARRGGAGGDPQLDVGPAAGLVLVDAGAADRRPARRRHPRPADRHALRRPPARTARCARTSAVKRSCAEARAGDGVSPEAVDAALRIRERLGIQRQGRARDVPLPHVLRARRDAARLRARRHEDVPGGNPGEVVVIINQDYVTPEDFVGAVRDAGLEDLAYNGPAAVEVADTARDDRREPALVFLAENHAGAAPWYQLAYKQDHRGDAVHVPQGRAAHEPGRAGRQAASQPRARRARRSSWSTTGSRPTRCRSRRTRRR